MIGFLAAWRIWVPALVLATVVGWHWRAVSHAETRGRDAALADVRSATVAKGVLADAAANTVEACYATGRKWNRETGTCAK